MNFQVLQRQLSQIKEIAVIGRTAEIDGIICHVMGMVRRDDDTLQLLILQYDEAYQRKVEEAEIAELTDAAGELTGSGGLLTNRIEQRGDRSLRPDLRCHHVEKVCVGDLELTPNGSSGSICGPRRWDRVALFTQFLLSGWNPAGIDAEDIDAMFLMELNLEGTYDAIPTFDAGAPVCFSMGRDSTSHLVELPVSLTIGEEYPDKLYFTNKGSGERHWIQINKVTLCDMWAEMTKTLDDPKVKDQLSPEELERSKAEFEEHFSEICPKGMCLAVIEYECEEGISLQFYSKRWLDAEPVHTGSAMGFLMSPDEPTGKLGFKLNAAVIPEPVAPDTASIEAELFRYHRTVKLDDIVMV